MNGSNDLALPLLDAILSNTKLYKDVRVLYEKENYNLMQLLHLVQQKCTVQEVRYDFNRLASSATDEKVKEHLFKGGMV